MDLKRGEKRADGMVFVRYQFAQGARREVWTTAEIFEARLSCGSLMLLCVGHQLVPGAPKLAKFPKAVNLSKPVKVELTPEERRERRRGWAAKWAAKNPDKVKQRGQRRRAKLKDLGITSSPIERLKQAARARISSVIGQGKNRSNAYIGCSWSHLKSHLQAQFQPGMTWENYGMFGWHVDHRIPLASATCLEEMIPLLHYSNLQPLWAQQNWAKGCRVA